MFRIFEEHKKKKFSTLNGFKSNQLRIEKIRTSKAGTKKDASSFCFIRFMENKNI
jgi:hypothetical protein